MREQKYNFTILYDSKKLKCSVEKRNKKIVTLKSPEIESIIKCEWKRRGMKRSTSKSKGETKKNRYLTCGSGSTINIFGCQGKTNPWCRNIWSVHQGPPCLRCDGYISVFFLSPDRILWYVFPWWPIWLLKAATIFKVHSHRSVICPCLFHIMPSPFKI